MKKSVCIILALAALTAVSVSTIVSADDITLHTSIGKGEVTYTEGAEVSISGEELALKIAKALMNLKTVDGFVDAGLNASLETEKETLPLTAEVICSLGKSEDETYTNISYSLNLFGDKYDNMIEDYTWEDGEKIYRATKSGDGEWSVEATYDIFDSIDVTVEENNDAFSEHITPESHLYEHDGKSYYACMIDSDELLAAVDDLDGDADYDKMAGDILGGNKFNIVFLVDAETGMPHALSLEISPFTNKMPGEILSSEKDITFSLNDAHVTAFIYNTDGQVEIPEEVRSAPVKLDDKIELSVPGLLNFLADVFESKEEAKA